MIKFQLLKKNLAAFQCFTGLNLAAFYERLPSFEQAYESDLDQRDKERNGWVDIPPIQESGSGTSIQDREGIKEVLRQEQFVVGQLSRHLIR